jgi:hypothetical protein
VVVQHRLETRGKSPATWRHHALGLRRAAALLWDRIEAATDDGKGYRLFAGGHIAMMLEGLAVEGTR